MLYSNELSTKQNEILNLNERLEFALEEILDFPKMIEYLNDENTPEVKKWFNIQNKVYEIENQLHEVKFVLERIKQVEIFYNKVLELYTSNVSDTVNNLITEKENTNDDEQQPIIDESDEYNVFTEDEIVEPASD